jgi:dephospho-CoA kinase
MLSYFGTDQSQVQRYLTARSVDEARSSLLMSAYWKIPLQALILVLGILVFVYYQFQPQPLLFEVADPDAFDAVVLVDAPVDLRRQRLFERSGLPPREADRLIAAQMPSELKRGRATFVIDNDADLNTLESRAREVWAALKARVRA